MKSEAQIRILLLQQFFSTRTDEEHPASTSDIKNGVTTMFRYDSAGNLLADDKAFYSYDAFNRTTKVETFDGSIQINRYDAEGLRHEMEENGNLVRFIFNTDREVVTEQDSSSTNRLIRTSGLIARNTDSARTYYHYASDEMGSTTHIVDEAGVVQNRYEYDAWGNLTAKEEQIPNRFTYYGQQLDPVTQQYYLRARFYDPVIGRFTQEDIYRGDGLNLYAYCANNPVYYVDTNGCTCEKDKIQFPGSHYVGSKQKDLDWRGTGRTYREALQEALRRIRKEDPSIKKLDDFIITKWARDKYGKSIPVEYRAPSGAILDIDIAHCDPKFRLGGSWETGPDLPHVGWTAYNKYRKRVTGHIMLDEVPTGRDYAYSDMGPILKDYNSLIKEWNRDGLSLETIRNKLESFGEPPWLINFLTNSNE